MMQSRFLTIFLAFFLSTIITSCVPISYECSIPPLDEFPDSFFKGDVRVLLLPLWYKPDKLIYEGNEKEGYVYFDKLIITTAEDLGNIKNKIESKSSFGMLMPDSAIGKWDRFVSLFMILENGLIFHLNAGSPLHWTGEDQAWREIYFGWIGPRWKNLISEIMNNTDRSIVSLNEFAEDLLITDVYPYPESIEVQLSRNNINKVIEFVDQIQIDSRILTVDKWTVFYFLDPNSRESISMRNIPKEEVNPEYSFPVEFPIFLSDKVACEMSFKDAHIGWQVIVELTETECKENGGKELWLIPRRVREYSQIDCLFQEKNIIETVEAGICVNERNGKIIMKQSN